MKTFSLFMMDKIVLFFVMAVVTVNAQENMIAIPTPNAASLGTFGQIPVSPFTGAPQVSLPLYTVTNGSAEVPIALSYHTSLVKPEHHPGWVGLGWSLAAGGSITRIARGHRLFDEDTYIDGSLAYVNCHNVLSPSDWASYSSVNALTNRYQVRDLEPDQFSFNFGDYSGTFYLDHNGQWQVQSKASAQIKITPNLQSGNSTFLGTYILQKYYMSFTLTTEDGTIYLFGNEDPTAGEANAVEFSVNVTAGADIVNGLIPTTWHLTKITSPDGPTINFRYVRGPGVYHMTRFVSASSHMYSYDMAPCAGAARCWESLNANSFASRYNVALMYPSYLDQITLPDNSYVKFVTSNSQELDYNYSTLNNNKTPNGPGVSTPATSVWKKLDNIKVYDRNNVLVKQVTFNYINNSSSRLFLNWVEHGGAGSLSGIKHQFFYNQTPLPAYNSGQIDHWGYYKGGTSYFNFTSDLANISNVRTVTESNASLMEAGVLVKIKYPTNGITEFDYQPHYYSSVISRYPFSVGAPASPTITGGLRIHRIISKDENEAVMSEKEYLYIKDYASGGTFSSGILAGIPEYAENWNFSNETGTVTESYTAFSDKIIQPLCYTGGSHITYSEVVERETENGYKIYKYYDSDSFNNTTGTYDYIDREAFFKVGVSDVDRLLPFNSVAYTRGLLKSESYYDEADNLQKEVAYLYNTSFPAVAGSRVVRAINYRFFSLFKVASAYGDYTYCPYVTKKIVTEYDRNGQNPVVSAFDFTYTLNDQLASQRFTGSDSKEITTSYKYPLDFTSAQQTPVVTAMLQKNIVSPFIEKKVFISSTSPQQVIDAEHHQYFDLNGKILLKSVHKFKSKSPVTVSSFSFTNTEMMELATDFEYNSNGRLSEQINFSGYSVSYVWGYGDQWGDNEQLPTATVVNSTKYESAYSSFETNALLDGNWSMSSSSRSASSHTGSKSYDLDGGGITRGFPLGRYVLSYWKLNGSGTVLMMGDNTRILTKTRALNGWTYEEWEIESAPATFSLYGTATVDDVRIYPAGAQMTSYTYNSLRQVTSQTDPNGSATSYEYDDLGRLKVVYDDNGHVLKYFEYKYKQQ